MVRRGGPQTIDPDRPQRLYKQHDGFDPSQDIDDIELSPGWYLLQGAEVKAGSEQETEGGIWHVVGDDVKTHNTCKVIKTAAEGCVRAKFGDYVPMPAYTNEHSNLKAIPWIRFLGDEESLWLIHDDNIPARIKGKK